MKKILLVLALFPLFVFAQLNTASIFSSNMVLQRDAPIKIWGTATPGDKVEVSLGKLKREGKVEKDSTWSVVLPKQAANSESQSLIITSGDSQIIFQDILIGDVWLAIGQSNMEWTMGQESHWNEEKQHAKQDQIRFINPPPVGRNVYAVSFSDSLINRLNKGEFYDWNGWRQTNANTVIGMSAVSYYFAKSVNSAIEVPIGIINTSIGGAPLETFIGTEALESDKEFSDKVEGNWLYNDALPVWIRERGVQNVGGLSQVPSDKYGPMHAYKPGVAYEYGLKPLFDIPIKGVLNYQGESNAQEIERVMEYAELSKIMVEDYRKKWGQKKLPFYFVQLSSIDTLRYKGHLWPEFRDEQRKMLDLIPYSGMAVSSDIGAKDDVHPRNKKDVGERLARWALNKTYKQKVVPSGPLPINAVYKDNQIQIKFKHTAKQLRTADNETLRGFSIDGKTALNAVIKKNKVIIPVTEKPKYVYYGWKSFSDGNLINAENLPASTFKIVVR